MFARLAAKTAEAAHPAFDFCVVDEAQDVGVAELRFLAALGGGRPNSFETMEAYPGLVHGAFFWDTWIAVNEGHWESPSVHRAYSFRGKLSEPKYTLTAQPEPSDGHEAVEGGAGDAGDLGDGGLGHAQLEEVTDFILLAVES